jgi:hypothetical protein
MPIKVLVCELWIYCVEKANSYEFGRAARRGVLIKGVLLSGVASERCG